LNRSMAMERDQGNFDALLLAPVDRSAIFFGKLVGNFIFTIAVGLLLLPLMTVLFSFTMLRPWMLAVLLLGTLGFSTIGTLLATMTVQTRARESLLPIVMLPMALPIVLAAVKTSTGILNDTPQVDWIIWPQVLIAIDIIFLTLCYLLFGYVIEE
jgi:heme exporter protein B